MIYQPYIEKPFCVIVGSELDGAKMATALVLLQLQRIATEEQLQEALIILRSIK